MTDQPDLFAMPFALTPVERRRLKARYRPKGYAAVPGTGPAGETCRTCRHYTHKRMANSYRKCELMRDYWTGGPGTDIKAGSPACRRWEKPDGSD
jgi:hypothetical protein